MRMRSLRSRDRVIGTSKKEGEDAKAEKQRLCSAPGDSPQETVQRRESNECKARTRSLEISEDGASAKAKNLRLRNTALKDFPQESAKM